ncbi:MAG: prepilin-type N-terminal cleavage/methylation domain-containing protein [Candidatus Omnitrophica bacterium]|nr:prepilin-type N-terminal cleavage/methylation domain-containing protein [Candidatus Omnitrophota bacterium]
MKKQNKSLKSGFTLIEISFSLLILAIGLLGILVLFPLGFDAASKACNLTEATFTAQSMMEDLKKDRYANLEVGVETGVRGNFDYNITVSQVGGLELRQVDLQVLWPIGSENQSNVTLTSYIGNREP